MGKKIDIDRAIDAFRRTCPDSTEIYECFGSKCKEHSYRCNYICKRLRRFIDILKEPEQQDYGTVHIKHRKENSMTGEEIITVIKAMKDPVGDGDYWKGYNAALDDLLSFIDSTEKEAVCTGIGEPKEESGVLGEMIKEMKEEPVSEDIWKISKQYALRQVFASTDTKMTEQAYFALNLFSGHELAVAHKDGMLAMKQQMMKKAVNGIVCKNIHNELRVHSETIPDNHPSGVKFGDDVRLIIIKEE